MKKQILATLLAVLVSVPALATETKIPFNFANEEITKVLETYSKAFGQKFVIDPSVRGKISILVPEPVSQEEAFNHICSALALNGYGFSKQGDTLVIQSARNVQRNLLEVTTTVPPVSPNKMITWIYTAKNVSAEELNRDLRVLVSKDGEMTVNSSTNQMVFSDWAANINRIAAILKEIDKKADPATAKIVESSRKARQQMRAEQGNPRLAPRPQKSAAPAPTETTAE